MARKNNLFWMIFSSQEPQKEKAGLSYCFWCCDVEIYGIMKFESEKQKSLTKCTLILILLHDRIHQAYDPYFQKFSPI